jgi:argininosuccinate lyase
LSRLASDLVLFSTTEFAFVELPEEMTTGSSMMPQKRNPDLFELTRAHWTTALGALVQALAIPAKLPSGYHRDLQLLKAPLFRVIDLTHATCDLLAATLPHLHFRPENIEITADLLAAEEAHRLALDEGIPFREAYQRVAVRVRSAGDEDHSNPQ